MSSGRAGRRAVVRWAVRLFRREWRQQALILLLLTVTVAAAVAGSTIVLNAVSDPTGAFGSAKALIRLDGADAATAQAGVAAAHQQFGTIDAIAHATVAVPGSLEPLDLRDQDPKGPYSGPMLARRDGRYPTAAGEIALTTRAARRLGTGVDSTVTLDGVTYTVVGIVENPGDLSDDFALVAPGTIASATSYAVLVDPGGGPVAVPTGAPGLAHFQLMVSGSDRASVVAVVLTATTLTMALVGLVAAAAFVVVAQRRQRQLGLLAAIGATDRHVRLVMIANGAIVGVVAVIVGGAVGVGGWLLAAPAVESAADHRIDRFDLPWTIILAVVVLTVVVATAAAWWPARAASRLPVITALSGRPSRPQPVHRSFLLALVLVAAGVAGIVVARPRSPHVQPLLLVAGLLAVVIGTVFAAPAAIRLLGTVARRLPFAPGSRCATWPGIRRVRRPPSPPSRLGSASRSASSSWRRPASRAPTPATCPLASCSSRSAIPGQRRTPTSTPGARPSSTSRRRASRPYSAAAPRRCPSTSPSIRPGPTTPTRANRWRSAVSRAPTRSSRSATRTSQRPRCSPSTTSIPHPSTVPPTCSQRTTKQ